MDSEQLLRFDPSDSELIFPFELNKRLSSYIILSNITRNHVAFKMKTTNQAKYRVRPRIGILSPGSTCKITVTTNAPNSTRCKDKFMIQSTIVSPNSVLEDAKQIFERVTVQGFQEHQMRVFFRHPSQISSSPGPSMLETSNSNVSEVNTSVPNSSASQQMHATKLLKIEESEIQFLFKLSKESSSSLKLSNMTENTVAFMATTSSSKHSVEPSKGLIAPHSTTSLTVKMALKLEFPSRLQNEDKLVIRSMIATTEDISQQDTFDNSPVEEHEIQIHYTHAVESIIRGVVFVLMIMLSWYLMRRTISFIWSLVMMAVMLMVKMVRKMVSDSVEDWIVKTLIYVLLHVVFGRNKANTDVRKD